MDKGIVKVQVFVIREVILSAPLRLCHVVRLMGSGQCVVFGSCFFVTFTVVGGRAEMLGIISPMVKPKCPCLLPSP